MLNFECWMLSYSRLKPAIENWSLRQCCVLSVECWIGRCYACDDELFNCELMHLTLVLNSWIICGNSWLKVLYACCVFFRSRIIHEFNIKHLTLNIGTKPTAMLNFECWMVAFGNVGFWMLNVELFSAKACDWELFSCELFSVTNYRELSMNLTLNI